MKVKANQRPEQVWMNTGPDDADSSHLLYIYPSDPVFWSNNNYCNIINFRARQKEIRKGKPPAEGVKMKYTFQFTR